MKDEEKSLLILLESETQHYYIPFQQACQVVRDENVSNYPIVFATTEQLTLGIPITQIPQSTKWSYRMTTLEELVAKQLVHQQKVDDFRELYKERQNTLCLFAVYEGGQSKFVFVPPKASDN